MLVSCVCVCIVDSSHVADKMSHAPLWHLCHDDVSNRVTPRQKLHALDFRAIDDTLLVRRRFEAQPERTFDPVGFTSAATLLVAQCIELGLDRLGDELAATDMTFLESNATRTVDATEGLGEDRGKVGRGSWGQVLAESTTETDTAGESGSIGTSADVVVIMSCFDKHFEDVSTQDIMNRVDVVLVALGVERGGGATFGFGFGDGGDGDGVGTFLNGDGDAFGASDLLPWRQIG